MIQGVVYSKEPFLLLVACPFRRSGLPSIVVCNLVLELAQNSDDGFLQDNYAEQVILWLLQLVQHRQLMIEVRQRGTSVRLTWTAIQNCRKLVELAFRNERLGAKGNGLRLPVVQVAIVDLK